MEAGQLSAAVTQVVALAARSIGGTEHLDGELLSAAPVSGLGERHDGLPLVGSEPPGRVDVPAVAAPGDVQPGDKPDGLVGLVVAVGGPPFVGELEQDRLDQVGLPGRTRWKAKVSCW